MKQYETTWIRAIVLVQVVLLVAGSVLFTSPAVSQESKKDPDPERFQEQIDQYLKQDQKTDHGDRVIVFAGSSSIRSWPGLDAYFPDHKVLNRGFGGSQMSDLLYYVEELILKHQPVQIFIYEGDNDIAAAGKQPETIMNDTRALVDRIRETLPEVPIVFLAAKPSPSRWQFKDAYKSFNKKLQTFCSRSSKLAFVDVWDVMVTDEGKLKHQIFRDDGVHMNKEGYDLWAKVIKPHLVEPRTEEATGDRQQSDDKEE